MPVLRDGFVIPVCPHCRVEAELRTFAFGRRWECPVTGCGARVGIHQASPRAAPLGTLARWPLRALRMQAHDAFDPLWRSRPAYFGSRKGAYTWLAAQLGIPFKRCHFGEFDEDLCHRALAVIASLAPAERA